MTKLSKEDVKRIEREAKEHARLVDEANMANDEYDIVKSQIDKKMFNNILNSDTENETFIKCQPEFFALLQAYTKKFEANRRLLQFNESGAGKEFDKVIDELIEDIDPNDVWGSQWKDHWDEHWNEAYERQYRPIHRAYNSKGELIAEDRT